MARVTKSIVVFDGKEIVLGEVGEGEEVESPFLKGARCQRHRISIEVGGKSEVLDSFSHWKDSQPTLDEDRLMDAFLDLVDAAFVVGRYKHIDEFGKEFGYEKSCDAARAWKAMMGCLEGLERLGLGDRDFLSDLSNYLHRSKIEASL